MIADPLRIPLFEAAVIRVAMIVALLFLLAWWRRHRHRDTGKPSAMLTKMLTVMWLAPLLLVSLFCGGFILLAIVMLILMAALVEYANVVRLRSPYRAILILFSAATVVLAAEGASYELFLLLIFVLFLAATAVPVLSGDVADSQRQVGVVLLGYVYIAMGLSSIVFIRRAQPWGLDFLVPVGTAVALCDAGGFVAGNLLGGPRLAPRVSPNKTWSGALGGLLGGAAGVCLQWPFVRAHWSGLFFVVAIPAVAAGAIWGDLVESFIKRDSGVKDAGGMLKGFGGVLDRFDSFLIAIPVTYLLVLTIS